jgi:hypothetical protein
MPENSQVAQKSSPRTQADDSRGSGTESSAGRQSLAIVLVILGQVVDIIC